MPIPTGTTNESVGLRRARQQRQAIAFVIASAACFSLACLCWPLTVAGFESRASVTVNFDDINFERQEFLNVLAETLRQQMTESRLENLIEEAASVSNESASTIHKWEPNTVQRALAVKYLDSPIPNQLLLKFIVKGSGDNAERDLIALFAERCCQSLEDGVQSNPNGLTAKIQSPQSQPFEQSVAALAGTISRLEHEIESIASELASQDSTTQLASKLRDRVIGRERISPSDASIADSPFRQVSIAREKSRPYDPSQRLLAESSFSVGHVSALRQELQTLKSIQTQDQVTGSDSMVADLVTQPIGGVPSRTQFMLMGLFSGIVGLVVAQHYNPFHSTGFDSVTRVASTLRLPVVATLPSLGVPSLDPPLRATNFEWRESAANQAYWIFKSVLFGLFVVVAGFCLVNEEIRIAFLNNPFHGLARIAWTFTGK